MKILSLLVLGFILLYAELETKGYVALETQAYLTAPDTKHKNNFTLKTNLELNYEKDDLTLYTKLYAQQDYYDMLGSSEHNGRSFVRLDEAYLKYDFEDDALQVGKSIKFWGALEFINIADDFNPKDLRDDIFSKTDKLGVWNLSYTHYFENSELSLIVKLNEPDQKMADYPYVYYIFPSYISYDSDLEKENTNRASVYLIYSGSTDSDYPIDYAFIYENGYDSQRYFNPVVTGSTLYKQHSYLTHKFITYDTMVVGETLIKLEALYAKVMDDEKISDYSHVAFGVEHTLQNIYKTHSLGLLAEYYNYATYEDNKYSDLELFETMQNDLFLGVRYAFNDSNSASIVGGVVKDFEYNEELYYFKYESRFLDALKVELDYYYIEPSNTKRTAFALLKRHQRISLNLTYNF
ncbi:MAG: hypothetical protein GXO30_08810 [Epsilonproteobacteria bacterium]|nr:hypothetical protein [Campylobacterota bacterium]